MSVAIAGLGATCALGAGVDALLEGLRAGRSGLKPLSILDPGDLIRCPVGEAPVPSGPGTRTHRLAVAAAREAWAKAGLSVAPERIAVVVGTTTGGIEGSEAWYLAGLRGEARDDSALATHAASTVSHAVAEAIGAEGPRLTLSTACSSGANALLVGADLLAAGECDAVVAGGAEGLTRITYTGFNSLRLMASTPCRPFGLGREGLNLGEAGAFLVLQREGDAGPRHGHLLGGAITCDAWHMTAPAPSGESVVAALREALDRASVEASAIDYINAHATATPANDTAEAAALRAVFEALPPVSASKSFLGHTLGAAGAIEAVITVLALREGLLPFTANTTQTEPGAPEDLVAEPRAAALSHALSTNFAFGGNNAALVFGK